MKLYSIIPAAGKSKRMKSNKYLLPLSCNKTIIECTIENLLKSNIDKIYLVTYDMNPLNNLINKYPINVCINNNINSQMSDSIKIALNSIIKREKEISDKTGLMIALADQPAVMTKTINIIIDEYLNHPYKIVIPTYQDKRGHPTIFPYKLIKEIYFEPTLREIIKKHKEKVLHKKINDKGIILDIDYPEDYSYILNYLKTND
ncbi:MAG: nucleotidyltransferase family protein [Deferribacterota bacterium]|nr:nucleotidyltransferase family protein [Deferribacterota bacterium]